MRSREHDGSSLHSRGHLNPGDPRVAFDRFTLGDELSDIVRHVWVVRWELPDGEELTQRVLTYPAFNAVFEPVAQTSGVDGAHDGTTARRGARARMYPPSGCVDIQRLRGYGWAVGVLFRPCAARVLLADVPGPRGARADTVLPAAGTPLRDAPGDDVAALHDAGLSPEGVLRAWLAPFAEHVDERDRLVNEACRIAGEDASVDRAGELAARLAVAPRTLERLTKHYLGLSPKWLIECRRLQQAATTLFAAPGTDLSELAARLDYTDYAHFSRRYRAVLGESPDATRRAGADAARRRVLRPRER